MYTLLPLVFFIFRFCSIYLSHGRAMKPEKKLKTIKSHYAHEIRKDVNLDKMSSLKLEAAWPIIKTEIEHEIGNDKLACVPYITEANLYEVSTVFVPGDTPEKMLKRPLGRLEDLIDEQRSDADYVEWLRTTTFHDENFKYPHDSVKITLQDEDAKNKVRVIMINLFRHNFPEGKLPEKKVCFQSNKGLKGVRSIFMVTDVMMAKTVEFRANHGIASRIFHLGNPTPLLLKFEKFSVSDDGQLMSKISTDEKVDNSWNKMDPHDRLYSLDFAMAKH